MKYSKITEILPECSKVKPSEVGEYTVVGMLILTSGKNVYINWRLPLIMFNNVRSFYYSAESCSHKNRM